MSCRFLVVGIWVFSSALLCQAAKGFDGKWRGAYHSQPTALQKDNSYPEVVNQFEIELHEASGRITGAFRYLGPGAAFSLPVTNGRMFGSRACFDIVTRDDDMRWCVAVRRNKLIGTWTTGPAGGPLLNGMGAGVRLFRISADRQQH